tara:strand:+ start:1420 stop:1638 length:219 start_codon:yes stop_codon:yes gene_type:complete
MMSKEIKYSFVILEEYKDLEDGTPNFHYNRAVKVSGDGTIEKLLDRIARNSRIEGLSIVDINYESLNQNKDE